MATSTFLVTLEVDDTSPSTLDGLAEQIHEACDMDGLPVTSVKPWSRPTLEQENLNMMRSTL